MKNLLAVAALCLPAFANAAAQCDQLTYQLDAFGFQQQRLVPVGGCSSTGMLMYSGTVQQPVLVGIDSTMAVSGGSVGVNPATLALKFDVPVGTIGQYLRGDGTLAVFPAAPAAFNFGDPSARTIAVSTSYQANDPSKAAVITISPSCTNATTVLASSACTLQVRQHTAAVNCGTGTVVSTWTSTYTLGLLLTNASGSPIDIKLGIGRYFIVCPTAGTFTITTAVDQSAG